MFIVTACLCGVLVITSSNWQRHSMDESSLSFYKEETFSEERQVIGNSPRGDTPLSPRGESSCPQDTLSATAGCVATCSEFTAPEREERPRGPTTPPPPPVPTVSPPASPEEASASSILGVASDILASPLAPLGLPPPALTRTSVDVPSALRLAKRLFNLEGFKKIDVSHHLSKK